MKKVLVGLSILTMAVTGGRTASAVTIDFETLVDLEAVGAQFTGLTFLNTTALASATVGGTLNELEFPPLSGVTVVSDDGGPITIAFDTSVSEVGGFFTYAVPVIITAFDALLVPVATATSAFGSNLALSGDAGSAPNELLLVTFAGGIMSLTLQGDAGGMSFTLDDLTYVPLEPAAPTPTPGTAVLVAAGLAAVALRRWRAPLNPNAGRASIVS